VLVISGCGGGIEVVPAAVEATVASGAATTTSSGPTTTASTTSPTPSEPTSTTDPPATSDTDPRGSYGLDGVPTKLATGEAATIGVKVDVGGVVVMQSFTPATCAVVQVTPGIRATWRMTATSEGRCMVRVQQEATPSYAPGSPTDIDIAVLRPVAVRIVRAHLEAGATCPGTLARADVLLRNDGIQPSSDELELSMVWPEDPERRTKPQPIPPIAGGAELHQQIEVGCGAPSDCVAQVERVPSRWDVSLAAPEHLRSQVAQTTPVRIETVLPAERCPLLLADLAISEPTITACQEGCITTITAEVANQGAADVPGPIEVRWEASGGRQGVARIEGLAPGAKRERELIATFEGSCYGADCVVSVTIDPRDHVRERDEANNTATSRMEGAR
jgi:hypothetical protein